MKVMATVISALLFFIGSQASACDEECRKHKAEQASGAKFPSYLSWEFCEDTLMDFMTSSMESLDNYRTNHFDTRYKGGMRNIKNYVEQRREWLTECDDYLTQTRKGRIFDDSKTTDGIFQAMDSITRELGDLIDGASYDGQDSSVIINEKFGNLLKRVDDHKTLLHLKGRIVTR